MNRARISSITHGDRPYHNPLEPPRVEQALDVVAPAPSHRTLDVGCGAGELTLRLVERFGCGGLGIDDAPVQIEAARRRAAQRAPGADIRFEVADARAGDPPGAPYDLVCCIGSMHAAGDGLAAALARLASLARPGGHVLVGDGYWRRPPGDEYLEALGATADELPGYAGLIGAGAGCGLEALYATVASDDEWDRYEWTLIANGLRFATDHPEDPDAEHAAAWARRARARLLVPGGRDTLGFALVVFRRAD